jgi:hypothetical protein
VTGIGVAVFRLRGAASFIGIVFYSFYSLRA